MSAGRQVPCGERVERNDFGVVFAGAVTVFGENLCRTVVKIGRGNGGEKARLPGTGSKLRAGAQGLARSAVIEASA